MVILTLTQLTRLAITCGAIQKQYRLLISLGKRFTQQCLGSSSGGGLQARGPSCGQQGVWSLRYPSLPLFLPVVPPSFLGAGAAQEVLGLAGTDVELECQTSGVPTPQVEWTKDGQ